MSQPGDASEVEADRVAELVMKSPNSSARDTWPSKSPAGSSHLADGITRDGHSLPASLRSFFEPRFGHDFGDVRIHTDSHAADSARALGAEAYTLGHDIVFDDGKYSPGSESGRKLIAHELTHVVQQERDAPGPVRRQKAPADPLALPIVAQRDYKHASTFKDKGRISIVASTKIVKSTELLHPARSGTGRVPFEYVLEHKRHVEVSTPSGDKATLVIDANVFLPFESVKARPHLTIEEGLALAGDFSRVRWSLEGQYGTEKFARELHARYGISGTPVTLGGKSTEAFFASSLYRSNDVKPADPREPHSLKELAAGMGPAFLRFGLSDRQQYQALVDYLEGQLPRQLEAEANIRRKLEAERREHELPTPHLAVSIDQAAAKLPEDLKSFELPGWAKGILLALGIALAAVAVVALIAAVIAGAAYLAAGAAFAATFWAAFEIIGTGLLVLGFIRALINRFGESELSGVGDFFRKLGVSLIDTLMIGELIESFTDHSLITGKPLNLSETEKWKRRTLGVIAVLGAAFGVRSWLKRGATPDPVAPRDPVPVTISPDRAREVAEVDTIFRELGGRYMGFKPDVVDPTTVIVKPNGFFTRIGDLAESAGGAVTDIRTKEIWITEAVVKAGGVSRRWGWLNLKQVSAHEMGHGLSGRDECAFASRAGADLPSLSPAERMGLLDDAVHIARQVGIRVEDLDLPPGYTPPPYKAEYYKK